MNHVLELQKLKSEIATVNQKVLSHEEICAERYMNINGSLASLEATVRLIFGRFWKIAVGVILVLLTIVGSLYISNDNLRHNSAQVEHHGP